MTIYATELYPVYLIAKEEWHFEYSSEIDVTDEEEKWIEGAIETFDEVQAFIGAKLQEANR